MTNNIIIIQGIGLNAQGFVNAILFCLCTKQVRDRLIDSSKMLFLRFKLWCKAKFHRDIYFETSYSAQYESVKVLIKKDKTDYGSSALEASQLNSYETWTE